MHPYYQDSLCTIYHGDCREILPKLEHQPDTCIVDPVWPNSVFRGVKNPQSLFAECCEVLTVDRIVVHLGCTSDPRFLAAVPTRFPFLRVCWLRYARPSYRGRILIGSDVAYGYGTAPAARPGRHLLSGESCARNNSNKGQHTGRGDKTSEMVDYDELPHPSPRRIEHLLWLINVFSEDSILDPFMGSGTTLRAAKDLGLKAIGIEIEESYCEIAANRLAQECLHFAAPEPRQEPQTSNLL